ncbi:ABC transporter permease [Halosolutus gelatinilyticus]|uniref:ABC transporter permease n=1 Tax=Halosolutus gelatinilyticus TaxID=2931975 RepID=UPI001FF41B07|nr:ABC transporter permease [Halosolutus gelatinilyticus]
MNWYLKRTLQALLTIYAVVSFTFVMIRQLPGGPQDYIRARLIQQKGGSLTTQEMEQLNALVESYVNIQPDKPLWQQYIDYVVAVFQGDLGRSIWHQEAVASVIAERLPWTIFLMAMAITLTFTLGITLGALMAYAEGTKFDVAFSSLSTFLTSVPYYVVAILLVYILGYQMQLFPIGGRMTPGTVPGLNYAFFAGVLVHAALPIASMVVTGIGGRALGMRGNSVRVMGEDYIRVAQLRGLRSRRIALHYVARNALLPLYTSLMISIGFMFGGAVILEKVFNYRGAGLLLFQSIKTRDYTLMMGCFLVITVAVVIGIYIADLTYGKLDPRLESGERHESF